MPENKMVQRYLSGLIQTKECYFEAAYEEIEQIAGSMDHYLQHVMQLSAKKFNRTICMDSK